MIYIVSYSWYEDYRPVLVSGPEVPDWGAFCRSLVPAAAERALSAAARDEYLPWLGCSDIVGKVVEILSEMGYEVVDPPKFDIYGSTIIRDESDTTALNGYPGLLDRIAKHNRLVQLDLDSRSRRDLDGHEET